MNTNAASLVLTVGMLVACGGQALDFGKKANEATAQGQGGTSTTGEAACQIAPTMYPNGGTGPAAFLGPLPSWPSGETCDATPQALAGEWTGYVQGASTLDAFPLPENGSISLSLAGGGASSCSSLRFGSPVEYLKATDAEAFYPPDSTYRGQAILPGFAYTVLEPSTNDTGDRLLFQLNLAEPWKDWCRLQTPYCDTEYGAYFCARSRFFAEDTPGVCMETDRSQRLLGPVSCAQAYICTMRPAAQLCLCDINGCDANLVDGAQLSFDLHVVADSAEGVVSRPSQHNGDNATFLKRAVLD